MPSAWSLIDASFPAFTGEERARDQINVLLNYMFMLAEGLKYQLSNLNAQNFNTTALKDIQIETVADVEAALGDMLQEVDSIKNSIGSLRAAVGRLEEWQNETIPKLEALAKAQGEQQSQIDVLNKLKAIVIPDDGGGGTIGAEGKDLYLVGNIYINGTLVE